MTNHVGGTQTWSNCCFIIRNSFLQVLSVLLSILALLLVDRVLLEALHVVVDTLGHLSSKFLDNLGHFTWHHTCNHANSCCINLSLVVQKLQHLQHTNSSLGQVLEAVLIAWSNLHLAMACLSFMSRPVPPKQSFILSPSDRHKPPLLLFWALIPAM